MVVACYSCWDLELGRAGLMLMVRARRAVGHERECSV